MSNQPYISPDLVSEYQKEISQNSSSATVKRKVSSLTSFFDWATSAGHLEENPLKANAQFPSIKPMPIKKKTPLARVFSLSWKLGLLVVATVAIFLLLNKIKIPIPFRLAPAAELTTDGNAGVSINGVPQTEPTSSSTIAASLTPWTVFTKTTLKDQEDNPVTTAQQITFKIYKEEDDTTALWTTSKEGVPDADGNISILLDNVPTNLFFENQKLFLGLETAQGEINQKIPLSTANEASNLQGFAPAEEAGPGTIPVIGEDGSLTLVSEAPAIKAKTGNLAIEGQAVTITTPTASDGNIEINPDGSGIAHFLFEGTGENFLNAQAPNLTYGSLYYGIVANNATGYDLLRLQSGSTPTTRFSVDARGNTKVGGALNVLGNIQTNSIDRLTSAGALTNITGYSQSSGNFSITQSAGDTATITKNSTALSDLLTLTVDERWKANSDYSTLTLKRYNGSLNAYALFVDEGNTRLDGQLQLGRFSANPTAIGQGSLVFNTSDNKVYVWDGSAWTAVGTGTLAFNNITSGTNTTAAMVVGNGASLTYSGTGTINAKTLNSIADTSFLRSDAADNYTSGTLTTDAGTTVDINGDLIVSDANVTFDAANTTFTVTGDLTITPGGGQLDLAGSLNAGGLTNVAYNAFADPGDAPEEAAIASDNDLYIGGDLEVDGVIYGSVSGSAGSVKWNAITNPDGNLSLSHNENASTFTWNTADTAAALDAFTLSLTNDASIDANTQRLLVLTNNDDAGATGTTERLLVLDNKDTNEAVTTALEILASSTGTITTALDVSDTEIVTALSTGANDLSGTNWSITGSSGNMTIAGTLAVNGDSITADGATLVINAAGTVDVQDALNADNITTDTGGVSVAASQAYTGAGAVTLSSGGGGDLTLDSASNTLILAASDTTLSRTAAGTYTVDLVDGANTVLALTNSGAGVANLTMDGDLNVNGGDINTASGNLTFQPAGSGTTANVQIGVGGAGSITPDFFGLDVKSDTGDPVAGGFEGAMYYNTFDNKFRCYQNAAWTDCIGGGGGGSSVWSDLLDPDDNLILDMTAFTTTMGWTATGALSPWTMNLVNNAGSATAQNFITIKNDVTTQETDVLTESLLLLDNADTAATGSTIVDNAILITNSGAIANGITDAVDASAADIVNAINIGANNIAGTNFDVDTNGHITVQPAYGLDVNVAGELKLGDTTATTVSIGTTAGTTISIGAGSGTATINNGTTVISGGLDVNGAGTNDIAGTLNLSGNSLTSSADLSLNIGGTGQLEFTDGDTIDIGGKTDTTYNAFANAADSPTEVAAITADNDVFIGGDLEVKGTAYITAGGTIDPGFTAGSVVFAGGGGELAQDNANFFWDDATESLGIGDNTPAAALTVGSGDLFQVNSSGIIAQIDGVAHTIDDVGGNLTLTSNSGIVATAGDLTVTGGDIDVSGEASNIAIADDTISALTLAEGVNNYLLITTTNDNEVVTLDLPAGGGTSLTGNLFISDIAKTINIGTGTAIDTINIGTGATGADLIAIGSANAGNVTVQSNATLTLHGEANSIIDFPNFDVATTGNITTAGDIAVNGGDITTTATTLNIDVGDTGVINFRDGTNTLVTITDNGTSGTVSVSGAIQTGTVVTAAYNAFGTTAVTHGGSITNSDDVIVSGDLELDGTLYLDGRTIANPAGTATIVLCSVGGIDCSSTATIENTLSAGAWLVENTANVGKAALTVDQQKGGDIFTASSASAPKVTITNAGNLQFHQASSITTTAGNLTFDSAASTVFADDLSWTAATPTLTITDGETATIYDGANNLLVLSDQGTTGRLTVTDSLQVAGPTAVAYSRFGTVATSHALSTSDDVVINGNTELDGILYLDGNTVANDAGTAAITLCEGDATCATTATLMNVLSSGSWRVDNASNVGQAALIVNQDKGGDIFTASSSTTTKFTIANNGNVTIVGSGTMLTVGGGTGKVDMGTIDPVYNIGGTKYATYMSAMAGVKEETTGQVNSFKYLEGQGYEHTIDFKNLEKGSDLWLFSKAVDIAKNIEKMVVLLTPSENVKAWYQVDSKNYTLSIFASRPTQISYRLTAPRFDSELWSNYNNNPDSTGFILEDNPLVINEEGDIPNNTLPTLADFEIQKVESTQGQVYKLLQTLSSGAKITIDELGAFGNFVAGNIKAGAIESKEVTTESLYAFQGTVDNLLVKTGLVSPNIKTALISPLPDEKDVTIQVGNNNPEDEAGKLAITNPQGEEVASITEEGNATFNEVVAQNVTVAGEEVATKQNLTDIEALLKKVEGDQNLLKEAQNWNAQTASDSANLNIKDLALENLLVTGTAAFNSLSLSQSLTLGTDLVLQSVVGEGGNIANSLNSLSSPLSLQSLALAPVEIMAGKIKIETNGDVTVSGNLYIAGKIESSGLTLKATDSQGETATEEANLLSLKDSGGSEIAKVNASGSAEFKEVQTEGLTIADANFTENPEIVNGEITTNATAGRGTISSGVSEITVRNQKITNYTLVYVTPTSTTQNNVLYVKEKANGYFKVGFTNPTDIDVTFNWWIIEIK